MKTETKVILIISSILVVGGAITAVVLINKSKKTPATPINLTLQKKESAPQQQQSNSNKFDWGKALDTAGDLVSAFAKSTPA